MRYHVSLQPRDYEILEPLVYAYRITTARIEAKRFDVSVSTARRRLDCLTDSRLLVRLTAWASQMPFIGKPFYAWTPGDPDPPFGYLAHFCQQRWNDLPVKQTTIYTASSKLLAMYALPKRSPLKLLQATHDLGVNSAWQYCRHNWPHLQFVGEEVYAPSRGHGEGVEDAQLLSEGKLFAVAEHAGSYRKDRLIHFHNHVAEREVRYFLF